VGRASIRTYPSGRLVPCAAIGPKQTPVLWPPQLIHLLRTFSHSYGLPDSSACREHRPLPTIAEAFTALSARSGRVRHTIHLSRPRHAVHWPHSVVTIPVVPHPAPNSCRTTAPSHVAWGVPCRAPSISVVIATACTMPSGYCSQRPYDPNLLATVVPHQVGRGH
jgi:hypothetical protein